MTPLDPIEASSKQNESPMAPPYVDKNIEIELTDIGLNVAENERRDVLNRAYEAKALASDDPEEALDDIVYPKDGKPDVSPEISAMNAVTPPSFD